MKYAKPSYILFLALTVCAILVNLGSHHLFVHTDEPRRTLVALELLFSGNMFYPTINGEPYLHKPAVFNWMIIALYKIFGTYDEWVSRLITVLFSALTSIGIYNFLKKNYTKDAALFVSLAFMINGRFLFYDSFLGMMDLPFAFFTLASFYFMFHRDQNASKTDLLLSYGFAAVAFLLKGLPAVYFQAVNVLVYLIRQGSFRKFNFTRQFMGAFFAIGILSAYYFVFFKESGVEPGVYFSNLFNESSKRTVARFGFLSTIEHFVKFPLDYLGNFMPWTLGFFGLLFKRVRDKCFSIKYNRLYFLLMILQLAPYWTSPEVTARYLYCILPFTLLFSYEGFKAVELYGLKLPLKKFSLHFLLVLMIVFDVLAQNVELAPTITATDTLQFALVVSVGLALLFGLSKMKLSYSYQLMAVLLFARVSYGLFLLPVRAVGFQSSRRG